jgi:hypothetical protein
MFLGAENVYQYFGFGVWALLGNALPGGTDSPISAMDVSDSLDDHLVVTKRIDYQKGNKAQIFYTENNGVKWKDITAGLPDSLYFTSVKMDDRNPDIIWVTTGGFIDGVKIFETRDGGKTWKNISRNLPNIPVNCIEIDQYAGNNALYIGTDVGVYYTNDSLSTWNLYSKDLPNVIVSDLEIQYKERRMYCSTFGRGVWSVGVVDSVFSFSKDSTHRDTVIKDPNISVVENEWKNSIFTLAPNPNNGNFSVLYETELQGNWNLKIVDVMGRTVFQNNLQIEGAKGSEFLELNLLPGSYFLRMSKGSRSKTLKFLVE